MHAGSSGTSDPPSLPIKNRLGTEVDLTRATDVIHFDRSYNPPFERQATDWTHRIGQTTTVMVHTLAGLDLCEFNPLRLMYASNGDMLVLVLGYLEGSFKIFRYPLAGGKLIEAGRLRILPSGPY